MNEANIIRNNTDRSIAIIGISLRLPGAKNAQEFWQNLVDGKESISFFNDEELINSGIDHSMLKNPNFIKASAVIDDIEMFDARFFDYSPREAALIDPQNRLFLECAWEALESSGYTPETYDGLIGIFAGSYLSKYLIKNMIDMIHETMVKENEVYQLYQCFSDFLTTNTAYKLNLTGPSVSVQTWCTTALTSVHLACQSIRNGECDIALAGGVNISVPQEGYFYKEGGGESPDGHCRSFDIDAQGSVPGSGLGVVVLKRFDDAIKDRDYIYAVIKGSSINNDGAGAQKLSYLGLTVEGQFRAITKAFSDTCIEPDTISFIEANGAATELADRLELLALRKAYKQGGKRNRPCVIGSVKPNIGNSMNASGIASLIKTTLALKNKMIPATINFTKLNPKNNRKSNFFFINDKLLDWESDTFPRRAAINSFGVGGTNVHIIMEEGPPENVSGKSRSYQILTLSAKTLSALNKANDNLKEYLKFNSDSNFADIVYTLNMGRKAFNNRRMLICSDANDAAEKLDCLDPNNVFDNVNDYMERSVAFMFPGYGEQYVNMALEFFKYEPMFRNHIDFCAEIIKQKLGYDLRTVLYPRHEDLNEASVKFTRHTIAGPALFSIEYSLARLFIEWGIQPKAMFGYSMGEYVAACLAGVFTLENALTLIAEQAVLIEKIPNGKMLGVPLSEDGIKPYLGNGISLAAVNAPSVCIVSGHSDKIEGLRKRLKEKFGLECLLLNSTHAFHSKMMLPIVDEFKEKIKDIEINIPDIPFISSITGTWITHEEVKNPNYWASKLIEPVRFEHGLRQLFQDSELILLETGPNNVLTQLAKNHPVRNVEQVVLSCLPFAGCNESDIKYMLTTFGKLWLNGVKINWSGFYGHEQRNRLPLPTYPFERERFWIDPVKHKKDQDSEDEELSKRVDIADWFYIPVWKQNIRPIPINYKIVIDEKNCWLVFIDDFGLGLQIVQKLKQTDCDVVIIKSGEYFEQNGDNEYCINPNKREDYDKLLQSLSAINKASVNIFYLWNFTGDNDIESEVVRFKNALDMGFFSLLYLVQAIGENNFTDGFRIAVITNYLYKINKDEEIFPEKALTLGPVKVIPKEYSNIDCCCIDIEIPNSKSIDENFVNNLLYEFESKFDNSSIAYRGGNRWVQTYEAVRLEDNDVPSQRLKERGVYLITGGLGGIGLVIAEYLTKNVKAKLILMDRSDFPSRNKWNDWLNSCPDDDAVCQKIRKVRELELIGSEILIVKADVSDKNQMNNAIKQSIEQFGEINGIIHLAGIPGGGMIQLKNNEDVQKIISPKVYGTRLIYDLVKDMQLDFIVFGSATASVFGIYGLVDYCAANAFMDVFSQKYSSKNGIFITSIDWDMWSEVGIGLNPDLPDDIKKIRQENRKYGIMSNEGVDVFNRILSYNLDNVIVSTRDLIKISSSKLFSKVQDLKEQSFFVTMKSRPDLSNEYSPPVTETEKIIAEMWSNIFGIEKLGIYDNFFDLGGHSLIATMLLTKINHNFQNVNISVGDLFDNPTITQLSQLIDKVSKDKTKEDDYPFKQKIKDALPEERYQLIKKYVKMKVADAFDISTKQIPSNGNLKEFKLESISGQLYLDFKKDLNIPIYEYEISNKNSIRELAQYLLNELENKVSLENTENLVSFYNISLTEISTKKKVKIDKKNKSMIFIYSVPRAGSTIFRLMLAGHPDLFSPPEFQLLSFYTLKDWVKGVSKNNKNYGGLSHSFKELMGVNIEQANDFVDDLIEKDVSVHEVYHIIQEKLGKRKLVDKSPNYTMSIDILRRAEELFDNPQYIYLNRHPYSVIESIVRNRIYTAVTNEKVSDPYRYAEMMWFSQNFNCINFFKTIDKSRYIMVRYEDLMSNSTNVLNSICNFLGLDFDVAMLHPYKGNRMVGGVGDPNIFNHDEIDASLGDIWKKINLPIILKEETQSLAREFNYELPIEDAEKAKYIVSRDEIRKLDRDEFDMKLENLENLSEKEVDNLLSDMLQTE